MPACVRSSPAWRVNTRRGEQWSYSSGGAWLLGDILERATGMSLAAWLEQALWQPPDAHAACGMLISKEARRRAHGFNATLEDWAALVNSLP